MRKSKFTEEQIALAWQLQELSHPVARVGDHRATAARDGAQCQW